MFSMARPFPRSALRSPKSPSRSRSRRLSVSFEDQQSFGDNSKSSTSLSFLESLNRSSIFTSVDKLNLSRELHSSFTSSNSGLSQEEIACEEVDDILPKTTYTYSKTATYSPRYLNRKRCSSPNMSRRRLRGGQPAFISDDEEEEFIDHISAQQIERRTGPGNLFSQQKEINDLEYASFDPRLGVASGKKGRRSEMQQNVYTSTPRQGYHISTHDHYYDGMLLRSGNKIEGPKWHVDKEGNVYQYDESGTALLPTPVGHKSKLDLSRLRGAFTTHDTITHTLSTTAGNIISAATSAAAIAMTAATTAAANRRQSRQKGKKSVKETLADEEYERKLRLDEADTEKDQHVIQHFYGLDSDEEISDVDDVDRGLRKSENIDQKTSLQKWSFFTTVTTVITTIITTVTTTITTVTNPLQTKGAVSSGLGYIGHTVSRPVVVPARWLWSHLIHWCTWLVSKSGMLVLLDVQMTQRRRRTGLCCWFLLLLFLVPFILLAGYYWDHLMQQMSELSQAGSATTGSLGTWLFSGLQQGVSSAGGAVISSWSWLMLWLASWAPSSEKSSTPRPSKLPEMVSVQPPAAAEASIGIDYAELNLLIQQKVDQAWEVKGDNLQRQIAQIQIPVGMTREEVQAIVAAALADREATLRGDLNSVSSNLKDLLGATSAELEGKIAGLEAEIKQTAQEQQIMLGKLEQTRTTIDGISAEDKAQLASASASLDMKLLDLSAKVDALSSQNAALTALVGNCCRNNSVLADTIRATVFSILAEMGTEEDGPLAGVLGWVGSNYVAKSELDRRLDAASEEVHGRLMAILSARMEEEKALREKQIYEKEEMEASSEVHLRAGQISGVDEAVVKSIVDEALIQFSADRVGLPDFALESAGGSVLNIRCSETFYRKTALVSVFGLPLWYSSNSPRAVIQPSVHPGECWAFKGQAGYLVIQLSHPIQVTSFSLEHIPRSLAPGGDINSAPYKFSVLGLTSESDTQGLNLGNFTYEDNGRPIQHYDVQNRHPGVFQYVELRVLSNHGNPEYTCIYRFRVHGLP